MPSCTYPTPARRAVEQPQPKLLPYANHLSQPEETEGLPDRQPEPKRDPLEPDPPQQELQEVLPPVPHVLDQQQSSGAHPQISHPRRVHLQLVVGKEALQP